MKPKCSKNTAAFFSQNLSIYTHIRVCERDLVSKRESDRQKSIGPCLMTDSLLKVQTKTKTRSQLPFASGLYLDLLSSSSIFYTKTFD